MSADHLESLVAKFRQCFELLLDSRLGDMLTGLSVSDVGFEATFRGPVR